MTVLSGFCLLLHSRFAVSSSIKLGMKRLENVLPSKPIGVEAAVIIGQEAQFLTTDRLLHPVHGLVLCQRR